ncbi:unnamed protein product, partial [Meganyctiphanes norvegica]
SVQVHELGRELSHRKGFHRAQQVPELGLELSPVKGFRRAQLVPELGLELSLLKGFHRAGQVHGLGLQLFHQKVIHKARQVVVRFQMGFHIIALVKTQVHLMFLLQLVIQKAALGFEHSLLEFHSLENDSVSVSYLLSANSVQDSAALVLALHSLGFHRGLKVQPVQLGILSQTEEQQRLCPQVVSI